MKKLLLGLGMTSLIILPIASMVSCASTEDTGGKLPPTEPDVVPPKVEEGVATQEILGKAVLQAKEQYVDSKITPDKFRAKDFDTEAKMSAVEDFTGLDNFNKNSRQIIIEEDFKTYTFKSEITKIEVDRLFANVKVFWQIKSITDDKLIGDGAFFTIKDFKVVAITNSLKATGRTDAWTIAPSNLRDFSDIWLTSNKDKPLTEDFDIMKLNITSSSKPGIGLDGTKIFTKDEVIKIKDSTTKALDGFQLTSLKDWSEFHLYVAQLFGNNKKQELHVKATSNAGDLTVVSNASVVDAIKQTYFNNQLPDFAIIEVNGGKDITGMPNIAKNFSVKFSSYNNGDGIVNGTIDLIITNENITPSLAGITINNAFDSVKKHLADKLASIQMMFHILGQDNPLLFARFSKVILKSLIENYAKLGDPVLEGLNTFYTKKFYGETTKLYLNAAISSIANRMALMMPDIK